MASVHIRVFRSHYTTRPHWGRIIVSLHFDVEQYGRLIQDDEFPLEPTDP